MTRVVNLSALGAAIYFVLYIQAGGDLPFAKTLVVLFVAYLVAALIAWTIRVWSKP